MGDDIALYYEHEMKISLRMRGMALFSHLYKLFLKHRWFKSRGYLIEDPRHADNCILFRKKDSEEEEEDESILREREQERILDDEHFCRLPVIQELKVILLNYGALVHDILVEHHREYIRYIHLLYFPF